MLFTISFAFYNYLLFPGRLAVSMVVYRNVTLHFGNNEQSSNDK